MQTMEIGPKYENLNDYINYKSDDKIWLNMQNNARSVTHVTCLVLRLLQ